MSLSQQLCRAELLQMKPNVKVPTQLRETNSEISDWKITICLSLGRFSFLRGGLHCPDGINQLSANGRRDSLRFRNRSCIHICVIFTAQQSGLILPRACFTSKHSHRWDGLRSLTLLLGLLKHSLRLGFTDLSLHGQPAIIKVSLKSLSKKVVLPVFTRPSIAPFPRRSLLDITNKTAEPRPAR